MPIHSFSCTELEASSRVDQFLSRQKGMPSRSGLKRLFDDQRVMVNGKPARPSQRLKAGDEVRADVPEPSDSPLAAEDIPLEVIFEDKHLIVFVKPAGMLTHPTPNNDTGTLVNALLHHAGDLSGIGGEKKPGIVHRLDKLTSGVMVAAKTEAAHRGLAAQFKAHSIDRRYLAVVYGEMRNLSGAIETMIGRNVKHRLRMTTRVGAGRRALTRYKVLARAHGFSLVECRLETGRTHQIRVHLSESNHPLVGDALYGKGRNASDKLAPELKSAVRKLKRQALHAYRLGFNHPVTDEWMAFESPLPEDIRALANALSLLEALELPAKAGRVE